MPKLYEIAGRYDEAVAIYHENLLQIDERLDAGEIDEEQAQLLTESAADEMESLLESIDGDFTTKAEQIAKVVRNLEAERDEWAAKAKPFMEEATRYQRNASRVGREADDLKGYLLAQMQRTGTSKAVGSDLTVARQRNGQPRVDVVDDAKVPEDWWIPQPPKLMRSAVMDAWKVGGKPEEMDGLRFEVGEHIRIR